MVASAGLEDYAQELERQVCRRCVCRVSGAPPCACRGIACGIEQHLEKFVQICRRVDSALIDPYSEKLHDEICENCAYQTKSTCPCPLKYLLPLAVSAVETVERRRYALGESLARRFNDVQETD